jgi:integrase
MLFRMRGGSASERVVPLGVTSPERKSRVVAELAEMPGVTPHVLRHTAATYLLRHVPLVLASRMIGHRSVAVTEQGYGHLTAEDLLPAARALDTFLR